MAGKATHALTAADFQDAVLVALGDLLSDGASEVHFRMVTVKVCTLTGISVTEFGENEQAGKPWVECWVSWAFKALCDKKLGDKERKGWWRLTALGKTAYAQMKGKDLKIKFRDDDDEVPVVENTDAPSTPRKAPDVAGPLLDENGRGFTPPSPGEYDFLDPYLVSLLEQRTKCFKFFSNKSTVCGSCQLRLTCFNALVSEFHRAQVSDSKQTPVVKTDTVESKEEQESASVKPAGGQPRLIKAAAAIVCKECGGEIPKGAPAMWLSGKWTKHPECAKGPKP